MSKPPSKTASTMPKPPAKAPTRAAPTKTTPARGSTRTPAKPTSSSRPTINPSVTAKRPSAPKNPSVSSPRPPPAATKRAPVTTKPVTSSKPAAQGPKSENWVNRNVQNRIQGWGDYAGGLVNGVGDGVNRVGQGVGDSITNVTRGWGQGIAGYGNDIKDAVGVGGPRVPTGGNPLGLAGQGGAKNLQAARKGSQARGGGRNGVGGK